MKIKKRDKETYEKPIKAMLISRPTWNRGGSKNI